MRVILAFIVGIAIGIAAVWYFNHEKNNAEFGSAGREVKRTGQSAGSALNENIQFWKLDRESITNELAHSGRVMREKANAAGKDISNKAADARVTATIKAKFVREPDLSSWDIHASTTDGVVTMSGTVSSPELIGKAMALALDTDGAQQVISTLQVKPKT